MIAFAYTECGLSIEAFFRLSWYEWSLEIEKVSCRRKRDFEIWEGHAALTRDHMALLANTNRSKNTPAYKGSDFIKLSFDVDDDSKRGAEYLSPDQVKERFKELKKKNVE